MIHSDYYLEIREPRWCSAPKLFVPHNVTTFDAMILKLAYSLWHSLRCCDNVVVRSCLCSDMFKCSQTVRRWHTILFNFYFARGSRCEVLWWVYVCRSVRVSVCLSARIPPESHSRSLPNFLCMLPVSVARSSSDVYDRPHRLSPGRGFLPHWKCIIGRETGMGVHSAGEVCYLRLLCYSCVLFFFVMGHEPAIGTNWLIDWILGVERERERERERYRDRYRRTLIYRSVHGLAPQYLADDLCCVTDIPGRRRLRSASSFQLDWVSDSRCFSSKTQTFPF